MILQYPKLDCRSLFVSILDGFVYGKVIFNNHKKAIDYVYLEVNDNFERLTGLKNVIGKTATEVLPIIKTSNPELFEVAGRVALTGRAERSQIYIKPLAKWFLITAYSLKKGYFVAIFENITGLKNVETRLEDAKIAAFNVYTDLNDEKKRLDIARAKEEAILTSIADGVIVIDTSGNILMINRTAEKLLGYTKKESIGESWHKILCVEDEKGYAISPKDNPIQAVLLKSKKSKLINKVYYVRKDKTKFPVVGTVSPVILQEKIIGAINIFRDITSEKEIDRVKNEFVSLASHQLRTPLTGIAWTIELFIKKEKLTAKGKEYLNDIIFSVQRSSELVKLLLNTSRIENGSVGVNPISLDAVGLINKIINESQILCKKKKISLVFTRRLEKLIVVTDLSLFGYILHNIINNAIDYTQTAGKVEVVLEKKSKSLLLTIKDNGIGIPIKEQGRIFGKFMRASNAVTAKPDGTGLGLYIAYSGTKLLGGKIWFESKENKGSTFFIELPLVSKARAGEKGKELVKAL